MLCVVLAGVIWMPLNQDGSALTRTPEQTTPADNGPDTATLLAQGAQELVARPLFHTTRRPPIVEAVPQAVPVNVTLILTGIVNSDDIQIALMRLSNQPKLLRLQVGDRIGKWEVEDITETSVKVVGPSGVSEVISLMQSNP